MEISSRKCWRVTWSSAQIEDMASGLRIRVYECIKGVTKVSGLQKEDLASGTKIGNVLFGEVFVRGWL